MSTSKDRSSCFIDDARNRFLNTIRPHSALGYRPPAPEIIVPGKELPMSHEAA
ncbi:MAG: hypothetical protein IH974_06265 [Myxococcales bacterium]|nr:hypothetical protein [Myxococcales bacterium]